MIHQTPKSRSERLIVETVVDETLVYDEVSHEAHCLNESAALVWEHADGETTVSEMADLLAEVGLPKDVNVVWMALERLQRSGLLADPVDLPPDPPQFSRKAVLRILGKAAGLTLILPAVDSVVSPLAAQAVSCLTKQQCKRIKPRANPALCTGLPICNDRQKCCTAEPEDKGKYKCKDEDC